MTAEVVYAASRGDCLRGLAAGAAGRAQALRFDGKASERESGLLRAADDRAAAPPTVYRALEFLLDQGLVHKIESLNAFVGCDRPEERHISQFLICTSCKAAVELNDPAITQAVEASAQRSGFSLNRLTIEAQGLCAACRTGREAA